MTRNGLGVLPAGGTLSDQAFRRRHLTLRVVVALHVPALLLLGYLRSETQQHILVAAAPVALLALVSGFGDRAARSLLVTLGLACCSAAVIGLSGGAVEAHYHVLVMVGFVALYQDWPPFVTFLGVTAAGYVAAALLAPTSLFDPPASQRPGLWAAVHLAFVAIEALAMVVFWRATEHEQDRATRLAEELTRAELVRTRDADEQNRASSELLSSLARRNQVLLDRQLQRIDALEQSERDPELLGELFGLDHLATRMRRNAESLLVLSGSAVGESFETAVPLSEICRGSMAEVEDYARVDIALLTDVLIVGPVVGDLVHLIAELIENGTNFSPPTSRVMVSGNVTSSGGYVLAVTDSGIGMADSELSTANATLGDVEGTGVGTTGMLGLRVVARLAARYGIRAWLQRGQGAGLAAMLALPAGVLDAAAAPAPQPVPAQPVSEQPVPAQAVPGQQPVPAQQAPEPLTAPVAQFFAPEPVAAPAPELVGAGAVTAAGLQRRVPKANLAAALADGAPEDTQRSEPVVAPDRARSVLAAYTSGVARARRDVQMPVQAGAPEPTGTGEQA